jgi:hypothetical protein
MHVADADLPVAVGGAGGGAEKLLEHHVVALESRGVHVGDVVRHHFEVAQQRHLT